MNKKATARLGGGTTITQEKKDIAPAQPRPDEKSRTSPIHNQSSFHQSEASFSTFCIVRVLGDDLLSTKEREKGKLSRDRGINGHVREWLCGFMPRKPFTAFPSEATFALTDDHPTSRAMM